MGTLIAAGAQVKSATFGQCNVTNRILYPGEGQWYHIPGTSDDLCKAQYDALDDEAERAMFIEVCSADDLMKDKYRYTDKLLSELLDTPVKRKRKQKERK